MSIFGKVHRKAQEKYSEVCQALLERGITPRSKSYTRFVILSDIRSGSTMLYSYLNSHPNVRVFFEPFHINPDGTPFGVRGYAARSADHNVANLRNTDPVTFTEKHLFGWMPTSIEAVGFKLLHTQARKKRAWFDTEEYEDWWAHVDNEARLRWRKANSDVWEYLRADPALRIILLRRENPLRALISAEMAKKTGKWGKGATGGVEVRGAKTKVSINTKTLVRDLRSGERYQDDAKEFFAGNPLIETSYERIISDTQNELDRLQEFLSVNSLKLKTTTELQQTRPMSDVVKNWEEVSDLLQERGLAHLLSDELSPT